MLVIFGHLVIQVKQISTRHRNNIRKRMHSLQRDMYQSQFTFGIFIFEKQYFYLVIFLQLLKSSNFNFMKSVKGYLDITRQISSFII